MIGQSAPTNALDAFARVIASYEARIADLERLRTVGAEDIDIRYCTCFVQVDDPDTAAQTGDLWQPL